MRDDCDFTKSYLFIPFFTFWVFRLFIQLLVIHSLFPFLPFFLSSFVPSFIQVISVAMPIYALKHKCQIGGMASFPCSLTRRLCHADELQYYKGETLSGP